MTKRSLDILSLIKRFDGLTLEMLAKLTSYSSEDLVLSVSYLRENEYIKANNQDIHADPLLSKGISPDTLLVITEKGLDALQQHQKMHKEEFLKEIRAWITLAIALTSLILSLMNQSF